MGTSQSSVCQVLELKSSTFLFGPNFCLKVETEAAGPLARVGAGLGSSLTSTLDLVQVFNFSLDILVKFSILLLVFA